MPLDAIQSVEFLNTDYATYIAPNDSWLEDPYTIEAVQKIYEKSMANVPTLFWLDKDLKTKPVLTFGFKDKNGHWFSRQLYVDKALIQKELEALFKSHSYLEARMPYLKIQAEDIESLRVSTPLGKKTISDPVLIQSLFAAAKKDVYDHPFNALKSNIRPLTEIYITIPVSANSSPFKGQYNIGSKERIETGILILQNYENTLSELKQSNTLSPLLVSSEQISKILIKPITPKSSSESNGANYKGFNDELQENDPSVIVISDLTQIENLLKEPLYYSAEKKQDYQIRYIFKSKEQSSLEGFLSTGDRSATLFSN